MKKFCCLLLCLLFAFPAAALGEEVELVVSVKPHAIHYAIYLPEYEFIYVGYDTQNDNAKEVLYSNNGAFQGTCYLPGTVDESKVGLNFYTLTGKLICRTTLTAAADPEIQGPAAGLSAEKAANRAQNVEILPVKGGIRYYFRLPGRDSVVLKCKSPQEWHKITLYAGPDYVYQGRVDMPCTYADDTVTLTATTGGGVEVLSESVYAYYDAPALTDKASTARLNGVTVCVDPGHQRTTQIETVPTMPGGEQTTTTTVGMAKGVETKRRESQLTLEIGLKLRNALMEEGAAVAVTREKQDTFVGMLERADIPNSIDADFVLRLHCNSRTSNDQVQGIEVYCPLGSTYAQAVAARTDYKLMGQTMLEAMQQFTGQEKGACILNNTYVGNNWSMMPSFLIEMGYMTNMEEDLLLSHPVYQERLVRGMVEGVVRLARLRGLIE